MGSLSDKILEIYERFDNSPDFEDENPVEIMKYLNSLIRDLINLKSNRDYANHPQRRLLERTVIGPLEKEISRTKRDLRFHLGEPLRIDKEEDALIELEDFLDFIDTHQTYNPHTTGICLMNLSILLHNTKVKFPNIEESETYRYLLERQRDMLSLATTD